jgi:Holliday junction DNA helicase RuvB
MNDNLDSRNKDQNFENQIRPGAFDDFTGQNKIVENLKIYIQAAKGRNEPLDHVLLAGPPGLGKTTLSRIIANELGAPIRETSGPILDKPGDLAGILTSLEENSVLFIDEIHRLSNVIEEYLYPAMEDFRIDIMIDSGPSARSVQLDLPKFTLVGATTRAGMLTAPLRSRFGITSRLDYYSYKELTHVIIRSAQLMGVDITQDAAERLASHSRGTPRIANRTLRRTRDFAQVFGLKEIDIDIVDKTLTALDVGKLGLDDMDKRILLTIINNYSGGPVGINTISTSVNEQPGTIEELYEPFLVQQGLLQLSSRGRIATDAAYEYFGKKKPVEKPVKRNDGLFDS